MKFRKNCGIAAEKSYMSIVISPAGFDPRVISTELSRPLALNAMAHARSPIGRSSCNLRSGARFVAFGDGSIMAIGTSVFSDRSFRDRNDRRTAGAVIPQIGKPKYTVF